MIIDASDDILAKYRSKSFVESSPIKQNCDVVKSSSGRNIDDRNSCSNGFDDIKKKLRLALSNTSEVPYHIKVKC